MYSMAYTKNVFIHLWILEFFKASMQVQVNLSEALIFASTNPQYDDKLFMKLQVQ